MIFALLLMAACRPETITPEPEPRGTNVQVIGDITTNTTWHAHNTYELMGRVAVTAGATLTIEPGTVIKGAPGAGAAASALIVAQGARIHAVGTAELPIIFTSTADDITPEDVQAGIYHSPNLANTITGLWGGVIVLGNAPISASTEITQIEGIPTSDLSGRYGGTDPMDVSGIMQYVSIRHGGTNIGSGNEINGLTLGGVGSGTVIDNIEIIANQDDGIELFGGTVSVTNISVWNVGDDGIDTDQGWSGELRNFIVVSPNGHAMELDGPEGLGTGTHTISQGLVIANWNGMQSLDLINMDDNSRVSLHDITFMHATSNNKINRVTANEGSIAFNNIAIDCIDLNAHIASTWIPEGIIIGNAMHVNVMPWWQCAMLSCIPQ
jgi:hypothetical protein